MSYFDSPKNRAIWERELNGLRAERERRKREGYRPQIDEKQAVSAEKKNRILTGERSPCRNWSSRRERPCRRPGLRRLSG